MIVLAGMGFGLAGLLTCQNCEGMTFGYPYNFNGVTTSSGTIDPTQLLKEHGVQFGAFHAVGYTGNPTSSRSFCWNNNPIGAVDGDDNFDHFTGQLDENKYYEVTIAPEPLYVLGFYSVQFSIRRSPTGIRNYAVRSSLDNYEANLPGTIMTGFSNLVVNTDNAFCWMYDSYVSELYGSKVFLPDAFQTATEPVTFRFYGWNAEGSLGTFVIDNMIINMSVDSVPEPRVPLFWCAGMVLLCAGRRRLTSVRAFQCPAPRAPVSTPSRSGHKG